MDPRFYQKISEKLWFFFSKNSYIRNRKFH